MEQLNQTVKLNIPVKLYQQLQEQATKERKTLPNLLFSFLIICKNNAKWQKMEAEANADLKAKKYKEFNNAEDLIRDLNS